MKKLWLKIGIGAVMVGITSYAMKYMYKQAKILANTKYDMAGIKINKINFKEISMTLFWKIMNESDITFKISNQVYDVFLNGKFVKKIGYDPEVVVGAHSDSRIPTLIHLTTKDIANVLGNNAEGFFTESGRKKLYLEVKGTMTVGADIVKVRNIPFYFKDSIHRIMNY